MCEAGGSSGTRFKELSSVFTKSFLQVNEKDPKPKKKNGDSDRTTSGGSDESDKTLCGAKCLTKPKVV